MCCYCVILKDVKNVPSAAVLDALYRKSKGNDFTLIQPKLLVKHEGYAEGLLYSLKPAYNQL